MVLCWAEEGSFISSSAARHLGIAYFEGLQKRDAGAEKLCTALGLRKSLVFL